MAIKVACACGKKLAVKDELAGKKVKCPACQKLLSIPKPKVQAESLDDEWDLGDSAEEDFEDEPSDAPVKSRGGKSSASRGAVSRKSSVKGKGKKSKSSNRGLLIGLSAGGSVVVVALLAWMLWPAAPAANVAGQPNDNSAANPASVGDATANPANSAGVAPVAPISGGTVNTPATSPAPTNPVAATSAAPTNAKFDRAKILNGAPEAAKGGTLGREVIGTAPLGTNFAVMLGADGQLPPALTQLPDWLAQDAPFDVRQYWVVLPPEQNAASLYLDALYEFVPHMAVYFPAEVQAKRTMAVFVRADRSRRLQLDWDNPNAKRNVAERDAFLQDVAIGFQKLSEAQKRPDCVFDVNWNAPYHVFIPLAAREVLRVGKLQVGRDIERGEFDAAIRTIGSLLRFSRDLRRRTPLAFQYLAEALTTMTIHDMVIPVLKSPNFKASQCDDLLRLLVQHETSLRATDPFLAKLRGDYLLKRLLLHDLQHQSGEFAESRFQEAFGNTNATRGEALLSAVGFNRVTAAAFGTQLPQPMYAKMFDLQLRGMKPADYEAAAAYLKEKYQVQFNEVGKPIRTQLAALGTWDQKHREAMKSMQAEAAAKIPQDTPREKMESVAMDLFDKQLAEGTLRGTLLASLLTNKFENDIGGRTFSQDDVVMRTRLVGAQALIALRRWYGTHSEPPTDLASVCREAGLSNVPRDPYGDSPLRMATFASDTPIQHSFRKDLKVLAGETVIYSVGDDGVDDQARKGNDSPDFEPGDWLFRLEIPPKSIPVTPAPAAAPIQ